jgi:hypothetical protein
VANKYYVKMTVSFCGEIEAENEAQANDIAYTGWGETADALISYDGVYSIDVDDLGEICALCNDTDCDCCKVCEEDVCGCNSEQEEGEDDN